MATKTWRDHAAPIIRRVLAENKDKTEKEIRAALIEAYPFGEMAYHPYKTWRSEIKNQRFPKLKKGKPEPIDPQQQNLFNN